MAEESDCTTQYRVQCRWMLQQNLTPSWVIRSVGDWGIETRSVTRSTKRASFPVPGLTPIPNTMQYAWYAWNATKIQPGMCSSAFRTPFRKNEIALTVRTPLVLVLNLISQVQCETVETQKESPNSAIVFGKSMFESNAKNGLLCQISKSPPKYLFWEI